MRNNDLALTHQILAILLAKQLKCIDTLEAKLKQYGGLLPLQHQLCSRVWDNMMESLKKGLSSSRKQDLFLEQIYSCASTPGFKQFFNQSFINMILHWQSEDGCFRGYKGPYTSLPIKKSM